MHKILILSTKNKGKLKEFQTYFKDTKYIIKSISDIFENDYDIEETGDSFEENAALKAIYYSKKCDYPVIGEDSGLSIEALNGFPGVYSARIGKTDEERNRIILKKLKNKKERKACFITVIALSFKGKIIKTFKGKVCGYIMEKPIGKNGFGYDPLFYYKPLRKTFAQIESDIKNLYSHRGRAIKKMVKYLNKNIII
jgi:XTP/dITP diphosphohydrolase